jgi:CheY-like chemotaxis protein
VRADRSAWTARPDFQHLSILIVDDEPDGREFLAQVLEDCGATVTRADDIAAAKDCVTSSKFDLIVTDLALPGEDGAQFLQWLRRQPRERGGATLAVTVTAFYDDYPPANVSGWAAYFQKPIEIQHFVTTIADILRIPRGDAGRQ